MTDKIKAYVADWVYVRQADLHALGIPMPVIRASLTVIPSSFGNDEPVEYPNWSEDVEGWIGLPYYWATERFGESVDLVCKYSHGSPIGEYRMPDTNHPSASEGQAQFIEDLYRGLCDYSTILASAPTGSGKTVSSLAAAVRLGVTTLVVAPTVELGRQWVKCLETIFAVPAERIGWVQQDKCDFEGKDFVVGVIHSLSRRDYGKEFRKYFGFVIWDESHVVSVMSLRHTLGKFFAAYRLGLSATPERKDGAHTLIFQHLGPVCVSAHGKALAGTVRVVEYAGYRGEAKLDDLPPAIQLKVLASDRGRNALIVSEAVAMYRDGRDVLVITDHVAHAQNLADMVGRAGVPAPEVGLFVGARDVPRPPVLSQLSRKPARNAPLLYCPEGTDGPRVPVSFRQYDGEVCVVRKGNDFLRVDKQSLYREHSSGSPKKVAVPSEELDRIRRECRVIVATYGMMKQGIDIPRLSGGIDATPRSEACQVVGRIQRPHPDKPRPLWVTIYDKGSYAMKARLGKRVRDYQSSNMKVVYYEHETSEESRYGRTATSRARG